MRCEDVIRLLTRYADKEIEDQDLIKGIESHIFHCKECSESLSSIVETKNIMQSLDALDADSGFLLRLHNRLEKNVFQSGLGWILEAGLLAKRLIAVPVCMTFLVLVMMLRSNTNTGFLDSYLYGELNQDELNIVIEDYPMQDLLSELI